MLEQKRQPPHLVDPSHIDLSYFTEHRDWYEGFPDLEECMETDNVDLLMARWVMMTYTDLPWEFVENLWQVEKGVGSGPAVVRHEPGFCVSGNFAEVSGWFGERLGGNVPGLLRTVTVSLPFREADGERGYKTVMVTGLGLGRLEKEDLKSISAGMGMSNRAAKNSIVNRRENYFGVRELYGYVDGLVKPVFRDDRLLNVDAIAWIPGGDEADRALMTISPFDSMVVSASVLEEVLKKYWVEVNGLELVERDELELYVRV